MKAFWKEFCLAGALGLVMPGLLLGAAVAFYREPAAAPDEIQPDGTVPIPVAASGSYHPQIPILGKDGAVHNMELDDYLTGVVLAEMPASFEPEALKAQAVVARTYTVRAYRGKYRHDGAAVCTDSTCCQGYLSETDYLSRGGSEAGIDKIRQAVLDTSGYVLTYQGELIEATYFSCSGGSTEDAVAVWGTDVPYLRATDSPGEENAAHYTDTVTFTPAEFAHALSLELTGDPAGWLGKVTYTAGGGVDTMEIGGISFKGTALRKILNLRSTAFTMSAGENGITVTTKGYGHRVGMSQYGADAMAVAGSSFAEILAHYYRGTTLECLTD